MSIDQVQKLIDAEVDTFRKEVEAHLLKYPMGVDYFGMKSTRNPRLVRRLRDGQGVELETIRRVRRFMADRAKGLDSEGLEARNAS